MDNDGLGVEYLQFYDRINNTMDGGFCDDLKETLLKIFCYCASSGIEQCSVEINKQFVHRCAINFRKDS